MKFRFIRDLAAQYSVRVLCYLMGVSTSGYYAWRKRKLSNRSRCNQQLVEQIRQVHLASYHRYGSPRIYQQLKAQEVSCSLNRVARLMRQAGIQAKQPRSYVVTTQSCAGGPTAPNLLNRRFSPGDLNAWVADLTYIHTAEGYLYLAVVLNLYSRRVIGWSMGHRQSGQLAIDALKMACNTTIPLAGQLHHSDRGGHYMADKYQAILRRQGMEISLSRRGNCYDNAVVESFFATLKRELLYNRHIQTRAEARQSICEYIEVFYTQQRLHSSLGYQSPVEYEKLRGAP